VSEVQVLSVQAVSGQFRLSYDSPAGLLTTGLLSYDISAASLQAVLNQLLGSTGIRVEKYRDSRKSVTYTITFGGDLAGRNLAQLAWAETRGTTQLQPAVESSVDVEVITLRDGTTAPRNNNLQTFTVNASGGFFALQFRMDSEWLDRITRGLGTGAPAYLPTVLRGSGSVTTHAIPYDVSAAELLRYLDPILNPNNSSGGLPHTRNVAVQRIGNVLILSFQGEESGVRVQGVDVSRLTLGNGAGGVDVATRMDGINYYGIETLNIDLGSGDDLFNVQGTSATTNLRTAAGADEIYVSSTANVSPVT
ncbi:MAG TPA: hypothetical protein DCM86_10360, partial [Verrucomicrobiales bacterium]|nr:hypothetical protein [Verrucomicrobiales bacterium]